MEIEEGPKKRSASSLKNLRFLKGATKIEYFCKGAQAFCQVFQKNAVFVKEPKVIKNRRFYQRSSFNSKSFAF
jgi:hypothetical protein